MDDSVEALARARLRDAGQRYTAVRQQLVAVLESAGRPLTAAEVVQAADLAQSSAYRNLSILEDCGVVHRIASSDEFARFELAEDLTDHHHHHLICTGCGRVDDFTVSDAFEAALHEAADAVAERTGFRVDDHRFDLLGLCGHCGWGSGEPSS